MNCPRGSKQLNFLRRVFIILDSLMAISCLEVERILPVNWSLKLLKTKAVTYRVSAFPGRIREGWTHAHCWRKRYSVYGVLFSNSLKNDFSTKLKSLKHLEKKIMTGISHSWEIEKYPDTLKQIHCDSFFSLPNR